MEDSLTPDQQRIALDCLDYVLPLLGPYEFKLYCYLLRQSQLTSESGPEVRIGKRTLAAALGQATQSAKTNYNAVSARLRSLRDGGYLRIGDTTRQGTMYAVVPPREIPAVIEQMAEAAIRPAEGADYYRDPELRIEIFERDGWRCHYCGEEIQEDTATLDHVIPVSLGGPDSADNLVACCLMCNSIKSGRMYEEAAPQILEALRARRNA